MSDTRNLMIKELKKYFVPELRKLGFIGNFSHFQRYINNVVDLFTIQFDRYGGQFILEISFFDSETKYNILFKDKMQNNEKINTWDTKKRNRICPWLCYWDIIEQKILFMKFRSVINPKDRSFYENNKITKFIQKSDEKIYEKLAAKAVTYLKIAEKWWEKEHKKTIK